MTRPAPTDARELDVRELPSAVRHLRIFMHFAALPEGGSLIVVNDHDPQPLRHQFDYEYPGAYRWTYLESGPAVWRVQIQRAPTGGVG